MLMKSPNLVPPKAPTHLSLTMRRFWCDIVEEFDLSTDSLFILRSAAECWDRAQGARELIAKEGLVLNGKRHPAIDVEKQAYGLFLRSLRQLGLDLVEPGPVGRPASS
jgi:hypothetical protein